MENLIVALAVRTGMTEDEAWDALRPHPRYFKPATGACGCSAPVAVSPVPVAAPDTGKKGLDLLFEKPKEIRYRHTCTCGKITVNRNKDETCQKCKKEMTSAKVIPRSEGGRGGRRS